METIGIYVGVSALIGFAAYNRGRSFFGFFLLSVVFTPLIGLIAILLMGDATEGKPDTYTHTKCPDCAELILKEARVCKHCGCKLVVQG